MKYSIFVSFDILFLIISHKAPWSSIIRNYNYFDLGFANIIWILCYNNLKLQVMRNCGWRESPYHSPSYFEFSRPEVSKYSLFTKKSNIKSVMKKCSDILNYANFNIDLWRRVSGWMGDRIDLRKVTGIAWKSPSSWHRRRSSLLGCTSSQKRYHPRLGESLRLLSENSWISIIGIILVIRLLGNRTTLNLKTCKIVCVYG